MKSATAKLRIIVRTTVLIALALTVTIPPIRHVAATSPLYGYSRQWGSFGGPSAPNMVAIDAQGNLYVTDGQNLAVGKMSKTGTLLALWGGPSQFNNPFGIAVDNARAAVYVTDSVNNNVYKYNTAGTLLATWNTNGTSNGNLHIPMGIAVNSTGYVYVVDQGNQRVGIWNGNPTIPSFVRYFKLAGPGDFVSAVGITVDTQGYVYVDDVDSGRPDAFAGNITQFTKNGVFQKTWGNMPSPQGLVVDNSTNIYVADSLTNAILKFNTSNENLLLTWGSRGTAQGQFSQATGLAVDSQANVFVSDPADFRVQKFSGITGLIGTPPILSYPITGKFTNPYGAALDSQGAIYIVDQFNDRVQKFNATNGQFIAAWGSYGNLTGQFNRPSGIAVDHTGKIYVTDTYNSRVQKFYPNGTFILAWHPRGGELGFPCSGLPCPVGIAIDSADRIYLTDSAMAQVQKFNSTGTFLQQWSLPNQNDSFNNTQGIALDSSNNVYVVDSANNHIVKFKSSGTLLASWGSTGTGQSQLNSPEGIALDSAGNIFVANTFNSRVEVFFPNMTYLTSIGSSGTGNGLFGSPGGIIVDSSDSLYVTDSPQSSNGTTNDRVEVFRTIHDLAASKLTLSRNTSYSGVPLVQPIRMNISVSNYGLSNESFWVREYANQTMIGQQNLNLTSGQSTTITISWFPSLARGDYNVTAQVQTMPGDPNQVNNTVVFGIFHVYLKGDTNGDCKVDIIDLATIGSTFGKTAGQAGYYSPGDLNNDGTINIVDLVLVASVFGQTC